ncbi:sodium/proton antiporter (CPA1 family) [Saccharopolyspora erythraea NRRL 2338]|uniref:Possible sodium/hydrogen antiporter n=2 Tax=Saccharopolyspora erythraea TaxID=1836 RepID=A4FJ25_SACEN|nr:Na+/H+ antiporter [Saccharopolyspora erythraea]EQD84659.1 sodium/hydrogen exchanger [Saccharopolyspora erythraea D]PFG97720.1 sodium/proton antiporter (CPA1 family) [Saccharopolyspora erythraea NRRL 2338]QRK87868.1 Na+/H+ antiporter [Saccharopolyspora erythraea]CAM04050.1 possible sodium/hydrogen antiporter [Saccharopolyspora erythraea NRRL 2338]
MSGAEVLICGLLVSVAVLAAVARLLSIPYPIVLVVGGAAIGFLPGLPHVHLDPEIVLVVFLPPLLYWAALSANFHDLRENLRALTLSSVGLVLATAGAVAVLAHALVPGLSWPAAFALGTIVSPTDPLAAGLVMRRLGAPRRLVSAVEGEGLFNDATALVAYRVAVAAIVGEGMSYGNAGLAFVAGAAGGIAIGLVVGWLVALIRRHTTDAQVSLTISLLSGYAAFIPANALGASGVLAAVTTGLYMGVRGVTTLPARTRLQGFLVWDIINFLINAVLFVLVGLQLRSALEGLAEYTAADLARYALAVAGTVVVVRLVWFFTVPYLIRILDRRPGQRERRVGARHRLVLAWSGMRGSVSLAAALALPLAVAPGFPFAARDLIIFLVFAVIFATLVVQGLSLPGLIRLLRVTDEGAEERQELRARLEATETALAQIDELAAEEWTRDDSVERMRRAYEYRGRRLGARADQESEHDYEDRSLAYQQMVRVVLQAQRTTVVRLRDRGEISNEVMTRIIRDFDLEEARLEI